MILGLILLVIIICVVISCVKVVRQAQALVIERLGAYQATWGTGLHFKIPILDRVARRVDLKEQVVDFAPQPVITKDNVTMRIDTVVFYQITDPKMFCYGVANPIMAILAGLMSFFSSGLGVVFPTLVPICGSLASGIGADGIYLVAMVVIGGTIAGYTPISTTGALIMAGVAQQEDAEKRFPQNKLFVELFAVSVINLIVLAVMAAIGVYALFV